MAEDPGQRRDGRDEDEQPCRQGVGEGEGAEQDQRDERNDVVDRDQADATMAVEQRSGHGADGKTRKDAREGDEPGQGRRFVLGQGEQHQRHADHRLRDARGLHRDEDPAERRDGEQCPIGAVQARCRDVGRGLGHEREW